MIEFLVLLTKDAHENILLSFVEIHTVKTCNTNTKPSKTHCSYLWPRWGVPLWLYGTRVKVTPLCQGHIELG